MIFLNKDSFSRSMKIKEESVNFRTRILLLKFFKDRFKGSDFCSYAA